MKKMTGIAAAMVAGMMMLGTAGSVFADVTIDEAKKTALDAVGLKEEDVIFKTTGEDTDDGVKIFEIDFFVPGEVKYEFDIEQATGAVLDQDMDLWEADDDAEYADLIKAAKDGVKTDVAAAGEITELQAKTIALKEAGLKMSDVTFTKCKKNTDDGVTKFEIEFRTADGVEHEYDIKAADGTILEKDTDLND